MKIRDVKCKTALSPSSLPGLDYSLNPYRGCQHNCAYCYVPNVLKIPRNEWGCFVDLKTNIPNILSKELKKNKVGVVGISTVTDPYQPVERKFRLTRYCLEQLLKYDYPVCIQTKSSLVVRDMDIISRFSDMEIMMTVGTLNDKERQLLEPNSSSIKERLSTLKKYADEGVKTSVFFGPIYPTLKVEDLPKIIDTFIEYGVAEIMIDKFNLKPGIWKNIEKRLMTNKKLKNVFRKNLLENNFYTQKILEEISHICDKKDVEISLAF
ncbi:MAG: radical SAM protein [Petrotogales bacterium]